MTSLRSDLQPKQKRTSNLEVHCVSRQDPHNMTRIHSARLPAYQKVYHAIT
eukprot:CAMPEP_0183439580 /NCGR_PEP_ID=MMETSP0370-20130417/78574_1 /TAXON_ID=268820 /ORGANISM="Peridinium aciculiferum, Strain PAER-2" /LENGTH=50 /DNA_ID=CAMNT_0025628107 /DNA_START=88 /DNA_END=236 /DNA_ORIENTATION=-